VVESLANDPDFLNPPIRKGANGQFLKRATATPTPTAAQANGHADPKPIKPKRPRGRPSEPSAAARNKRSLIRQDLADGRFETSEIAKRHHVSDGYVRNVRAGIF
jgi:hypothetical protein